MVDLGNALTIDSSHGSLLAAAKWGGNGVEEVCSFQDSKDLKWQNLTSGITRLPVVANPDPHSMFNFVTSSSQAKPNVSPVDRTLCNNIAVIVTMALYSK